MKKLSRRDMLKSMGVASAATLLAACQPAAQPGGQPGDAPSGNAPQGEKVVITLVESWFGVPQFKDSIDPVTQAISEKMQSEGLNIELRSMILDDHENKYTVLYSSGADFTFAFDAPWYKMNSLRDQNALVDLVPLIEKYGPTIKEQVTAKILDANLIRGKLWGLPTAFYYAGTSGVVIREDLRKKYDVPAPTSEGGYASLTPYLEAIAENNPELIPFANMTGYPMTAANVWNRLAWGPGTTNTGLQIHDIINGEPVFDNLENDPSFMEAAILLRQWWEKGLVNKTDLALSGASQTVPTDYFIPGKCAAFQENEPEFKWVDFNRQIASAVDGAEAMGYDLTGMRAGKKGIGNLKQGNFMVFNASAPEAQQVAGVQFFNWLMSSQDNMDLWLMGIEGVNWKKEDNLRFSEVEGTDPTRNYRRQWYVSGCPGRYQRLAIDLPKEAEEAIKFYSTEENWLFNPYESFEADTKAIEVELATLTAVYAEAAHGLNTGQMPTEEALKKFTQTLDNAGRQQVKEKLQAQLDAYLAELG